MSKPKSTPVRQISSGLFFVLGTILGTLTCSGWPGFSGFSQRVLGVVVRESRAMYCSLVSMSRKVRT